MGVKKPRKTKRVLTEEEKKRLKEGSKEGKSFLLIQCY